MRYVIATVLLAHVACASEGFQVAGPPDAGGDFDAATVVNGCTAADFTSQDLTDPSKQRLIVFGATKNEYNPPCMKVRVGQAVTWRGSFSTHPLSPDGVSFIATTTQDTATGEATFTPLQRGVYGYHCTNHSSRGMTGAILVMP